MARPEVTAVKKVASLGGGPIGAGWAAHFLARGYDVSGYVHTMSEEHIEWFKAGSALNIIRARTA